ncbi:MAG: DUF697 domain-containing protein [Myxococcales bacterium]|nr:DUF697 domain-containing protein [Myxococcales bacterium]
MSTDEPAPQLPDLKSQVMTQVAERWELAASEARASLDKTLAVAFLGSASSGKDAAIKALFGLDFGQVDPIPGSTDRARVAPVDPDHHLLVINAPGFGDLRSEVAERAEEVLDALDLAVYVVNCDGGATIDERRDLDRIRQLGRPTLVCLNKIDLIRPEDRPTFIRSTIVQLGVPEHMVIVTAFDPMPALSQTPIGVPKVISWIHKKLSDSGKALLFAKNLRNKSAACEPAIRDAAQRAAVAGAIPIPGADATAVMAIQVSMITELATIFDRQMDQELILFVIAEALAGSSRGFVGWAVKALKTAGWIPGGQAMTLATSALGATVASATTYGIGKAAVAFLQRDGKITGAELRDVFDAEAHQYRQQVHPSH